MKIGKILLQKRHEKKLSQQQVADTVGVSQKTYSNFESEKSTPSIEQLFALGKFLEFDVINLINKGTNHQSPLHP